MNSELLKKKRNTYHANKIPYQILLDNNILIKSDADFVFWDDASETVTVFRKNSKRGQGTFIAEEFSSTYEHIQHMYALHKLDELEDYMRTVLPTGSYTDAQIKAVVTYMTEMNKDENYIQDLMPKYTNKFDKKIVEEETSEEETSEEETTTP